MITAPTLSENTLTVVRNISRIRSTARIMATPSRGSPTAFRMMVSMTNPLMGMLAAPMEARTAVSTIIPCWASPTRFYR